jgi:glycosyltransferase involved in cell wall biosynthesis
LAAQLGIAGRVEFLGPVPQREELLALCRQCDVGLSLMPKQSLDNNEQTMTGASNKPFDYLACGLALLVSDLPDWRVLFVDGGYALAVDPADPHSIATAVRWLLEHPAESRAMGERGRQRILREWNYEEQFAPVLPRLTEKSSHARCS